MVNLPGFSDGLVWGMQTFSSNGVRIAFVCEGAGEPVVLIHGFASNIAINWRDTGWFSFLLQAGFKVIALDNRGHGESEKLYDPEAYAGPTMAEDARALLDHLGIEKAHVMGYSMGARLTAFLTLAHPSRVRTAVLAGLGANMMHGVGAPEPIAEALLANDISQVTEPTARSFRRFAEQTKSDRRALAACIMASRERIPGDTLGQIQVPVLVAVGTDDEIAGAAAPLAAVIPGAQALDIPGRDHMKAVGDRVYKEGVLKFLQSHAGRE